jgi:hypothetical protein
MPHPVILILGVMDRETEARAKAPIWSRVVNQLRADSNTTIECPFCHGAQLSVCEAPYGLMPNAPIIRWIICGQCHERTGWIPCSPAPDDPNSN